MSGKTKQLLNAIDQVINCVELNNSTTTAETASIVDNLTNAVVSFTNELPEEILYETLHQMAAYAYSMGKDGESWDKIDNMIQDEFYCDLKKRGYFVVLAPYMQE